MIIKAFLIDPVAQTISTVVIDSGLVALKVWLGLAPTDAIDIVPIGRLADRTTVTLVIDDNGRLKPDQRCFHIRQGFEHEPILVAGRALAVGLDGHRDMCSCQITHEDIVRLVSFLPAGIDYTPPAPVIHSFETFEELQAHMRGNQTAD